MKTKIEDRCQKISDSKTSGLLIGKLANSSVCESASFEI